MRARHAATALSGQGSVDDDTPSIDRVLGLVACAQLATHLSQRLTLRRFPGRIGLVSKELAKSAQFIVTLYTRLVCILHLRKVRTP